MHLIGEVNERSCECKSEHAHVAVTMLTLTGFGTISMLTLEDVATGKHQGFMVEVARIHPLGTSNICFTFHNDHAILVRIRRTKRPTSWRCWIDSPGITTHNPSDSSSEDRECPHGIPRLSMQ